MKLTRKGTMRKEGFCGGVRGLLVSMVIMMAVVLGVTGRAWAEPFAYVTNLNSGTVSVIDVATNTVIATVSVERRPSGWPSLPMLREPM